MLLPYLEAGGPVMLAVVGAWIVVLAGMLDRMAYAAGRCLRRVRDIRAEAARARRGLERIDAVSQLATSLGLFGTVLGIARSFLARGTEGNALAAPEALAAGLSTALYTTLAGLAVFLVGQAFLIAYREWLAWCERGLEGSAP